MSTGSSILLILALLSIGTNQARMLSRARAQQKEQLASLAETGSRVKSHKDWHPIPFKDDHFKYKPSGTARRIKIEGNTKVYHGKDHLAYYAQTSSRVEDESKWHPIPFKGDNYHYKRSKSSPVHHRHGRTRIYRGNGRWGGLAESESESESRSRWHPIPFKGDNYHYKRSKSSPVHHRHGRTRIYRGNGRWGGLAESHSRWHPIPFKEDKFHYKRSKSSHTHHSSGTKKIYHGKYSFYAQDRARARAHSESKWHPIPFKGDNFHYKRSKSSQVHHRHGNTRIYHGNGRWAGLAKERVEAGSETEENRGQELAEE